MTVVLHYHGGPQDGYRRRVPEPEIGRPIVRLAERGIYQSEIVWDGVTRHIAMQYRYRHRAGQTMRVDSGSTGG